jgi:N-acetylglucosaminyldiphosphoundecaprenol N-acetyl-beta-D-mannosaminyltransferase
METRSNVLGVGISPLNLPHAIEKILEASSPPGFSGYVTVTGVHGVMESQNDPALKEIHNQSLFSVPDGMPMVWVGKWNGFEDMGRVYGPDLMLGITRAAGPEKGHFYFGGGDGVARKLSMKLQERFPGIRVLHEVTPPFRPLTAEEEMELAATIRETKPHFFWVGLSTPKQERFMHSFLQKFPNLTSGWDHGLVMLGVGAAFDFHAGLVKQAPPWLQKRGLEWFFRLMMEPKRLWRRYLYNNPRFIWQILLQMTELKKF